MKLVTDEARRKRDERELARATKFYAGLRESKRKTLHLLCEVFGDGAMLDIHEFRDRVRAILERRIRTCVGSDEVLEIAQHEHLLVKQWREAPPYVVVRQFE
jgi:hypothetical protein